MSTREDQIHTKGFDIFSGSHNNYYTQEPISPTLDYGRIKVGVKNLDDAVISLGSIKNSADRAHPFVQKNQILKAIMDKDVGLLRAISNFFYNISGIYERVCNYFAFLYRYDWYVVPEVYDSAMKDEKLLKEFSKLLNYFDGSNIKKTCGDIALEVIKNGVYYGYVIDGPRGM